MKNELIDFFSLGQPNTKLVVLGSCIICMLSALTGCFAYLRKRSLIGDAVSHSVLPGICIAFILSGEKNPLILLIGAIFSGLLSVFFLEWLVRERMARTDTAITFILSFFFGVGLLLLTYIQHHGNSAQAGLDKYLFGKAASLTSEDLKIIIISGSVISVFYFSLLRGFYIISFDEDYAKLIGFPTKTLKLILSICTVWTISIGIQTSGVVLMSSLLIAPALASRLWTHSIFTMLLLSIFFGLIGGYTGAFISYTAPSMATGPWIVVASTMIVLFSIIFAPEKGILARWLVHKRNKKKMAEENLLKLIFKMARENEGNSNFFPDQIIPKKKFLVNNKEKDLSIMIKKGFLLREPAGYKITEKGIREGLRVVRLHRLWELYLQRNLHLAPDHVHENAEAIEHVITPEIETMLESELGFPDRDPHNTLIPSNESK